MCMGRPHSMDDSICIVCQQNTVAGKLKRGRKPGQAAQKTILRKRALPVLESAGFSRGEIACCFGIEQGGISALAISIGLPRPRGDSDGERADAMEVMY